MHLKRIITAIILVPALYFLTMRMDPSYFLYLMALVSVAALAEFYSISGVDGILKYAGMAWALALPFINFYAANQFSGFIAVAAISLMTVRLFSTRNAHGSIMDTTMAVFGLIYIPVLLCFQLNLIRLGPALIVMLYAAVWGSDSMALYIGKALGRRKLYFEISPNKTVEGAIGSFIGGQLGIMLVKFTLLPQITLTKAVVLGLVVSISTIVGDLVESMFKRDAGVKDSSSIIPGHGGILDKIDAVLFAGPAFYWFFSFFQQTR